MGSAGLKHLIPWILVLGFVQSTAGQAPVPPGVQPEAQSARTDIQTYIRSGWDRLSRSTADCASVYDPKVNNAPVVYMPFGMEPPPALRELETKCHTHVAELPRKIVTLGDVQPSELPAEGLLYLPNRYVVPGGRFNEMYGWDSYFIMLGLLDDGRDDLARGMVENFFFEIENYGALLNANRTYFLTRSQPPLLSSMIREVYEHNGATPLDKRWLAHAYEMAVRDHALWTSPIHTVGNTGLARYRDVGEGPVPEMADDSTYYPDVIRWLLAHPQANPGYLLKAPSDPSGPEVTELAKSSCDVRVSHVCANAFVDGYRLTRAYYEGDRAMRESGFDSSFRFGPFSGSTQDFAPVCLNSLLYKYEKDLAHFASLLGRPDEAARWERVAAARRAAIGRYMWNEKAGFFYDWDATQGRQSTYESLVGFYPLWTGVATAAQAKAVEGHLHTFEYAGGLAMSTDDSGTQWDFPYGWAPTNWIAVEGLKRFGFDADALRVSREFTGTVADNFRRDGTIREKYNVVNGSANIALAAGYRSNVIGFGWTNGVYLRMHDLIERATAGKAHTGN